MVSDELGQVSQHGVYACEQYGVCVCVRVCVCILRCWKIIEYETRKKRWNRLSSLEKLYSLYPILAHSHCHMKDALAGGETNGRQLSSALHLLN